VHQQKYVFLSICPKVLLESHPDTQAQSPCLSIVFASTKLYCIVTDSMDCLKVSIYISAVTQSWFQVNVNSSLTSYLLHHHVTSLVCTSVVKNIWQVYQTDNSILWDRFALPNTTRDSDHCHLRIYGWIPYRHSRMSVQYCCVLVFSIVS